MIKIIKIFRFLFLAIICSFYSCSSSKKFTSDKINVSSDTTNYIGRYSSPAENEKSGEEISIYRNPDILETEIGIASYYAEDFHDRETYSGEIFDMYGISAAHPDYPMGTQVRVTNLLTNKSIELIINDRMPFREDRIIDLSYGAAEALDMTIDGIIEVKVEVLKWGEGRE